MGRKTFFAASGSIGCLLHFNVTWNNLWLFFIIIIQCFASYLEELKWVFGVHLHEKIFVNKGGMAIIDLP
jgi:hypothetical protein